MTIEITGWHGGWGRFLAVDEKHLGSGEGDSQGWGFYFSENREGGEYFARYANYRRKAGYLHKVKIEVQDFEYWELADKKEVKLSNGEGYTYSMYFDLRRKLGDQQAARYLRARGIKAFMLWETEKPPHGYTYVVIQPNIVQVLETYEFIYNPTECYWLKHV